MKGIKEFAYQQPYGDLSELNANGEILKNVGSDLLHKIVTDFLELLDTSSAVYEKNGDYAVGIITSGWCRMLDSASRKLCGTNDNKKALESGKWLCHESCWTNASMQSIYEHEPIDTPCSGGINIYAVPIFSDGEAVGSINIGYGSPPKSPKKIKEIARKYKVAEHLLLEQAKAYKSRTSNLIEMSKSRLMTSARLIGEIVARRRIEEDLITINFELGERVKELNCLHGISKIVEKPGLSPDEIYQAIVNIIPQSWQYPEITCARISLCDVAFTSPNFRETPWRMAGDIYVDGTRSGTTEVFYLEERPEIDEGPFLKEERFLIDSISERLGKIAEHAKSEEALQQSLKDKDMLMMEIHHRTKNNLAVVMGLLRLQASQIKDGRIKEYFREAQNRVKAMSIIHERLYKAKSLKNVNFKEYIHSLAEQLYQNYNLSTSRVGLNINVPDVMLDADIMIPCGLIANELISNAFKYAFPGDREGELSIELAGAKDDEHMLIIKDNGIGFPGEMDIYSTESLGMQIVTSLISQIKGTVELMREGGTEFRITFRKKRFNQ
jgi:two-component sensor histidine kinase